MGIDSLTVVFPPANPVYYTSEQTVSVNGGVFSANLAGVTVQNISKSGHEPVAAVVANIEGSNYSWSVDGIPLASVGLNQLRVVATATDDATAVTTTMIYVDYSAPTIVSVSPSNGASAVAINSSIQVRFNEPMDSVSTIAALSLTPPMPDGVWQAGPSGDLFTYVYSGNLPPTTEHTISVAGTATDAIAKIDPAHVYVQAGNTVSPASFTFTTGLGLGAHDPTRLGFNPPQPIWTKESAINDFDENLISVPSSGLRYNEMLAYGFLTTQATFRKAERPGVVFSMDSGESAWERTESTDGRVPNPPFIIRPFRDKPWPGTVVSTDEITSSTSAYGRAYNDPFGAKTTQLSMRNKGATGIVVDYDDIIRANYIPLILNYGFPNEESVSGSVHKLNTPRIEILWNNPKDRGDARLYYRVEISRHPAFRAPLVFDSYHGRDGFSVSEDGVDFSPMDSYGAPAGRGKTKFVCPVDLKPGQWFVRMSVGNKRG